MLPCFSYSLCPYVDICVSGRSLVFINFYVETFIVEDVLLKMGLNNDLGGSVGTGSSWAPQCS